MGRVTDEERRVVARRLRGIDFSDVLFDSELVDAIEHVCGSKRKRRDFVKIVDRLADLIEPSPSCEFWDVEEQECYSVRTVRPVDRDALLALAEDVDGAANDSGGFEPLAGMLRDIASRIREALGVG